MEILKCLPEHKREVIDLILGIQINEFGISITEEEQPDLQDIASFYQKGKGNFWVCKYQNSIVGTISLLDIGDGITALRKMFVSPKYRGKEYGVSVSLLQHSLDWAKSNDVKSIYLGTTTQFLAAHRFYEKNGFIEVSKSKLPRTFPIMSVDSKFYMYSF